MTIAIAAWFGLTAIWFVPSLLLNLYTFGGIDFPSEAFSTVYFVGGMLLLYGTALVSPALALILVRSRTVGWRAIVVLLAVPAVVQGVGVVLYFALTDRYGAVCC